MTRSPKVLLACLCDPSRGPRPRRMIGLCRELGYEIEVLSPFPSEKVEGVRYFPYTSHSNTRALQLIRKARKGLSLVAQSVVPDPQITEKLVGHGHGFQRLFKSLKDRQYDLVIVEDLDLLPFCLELKGEAQILVDAREYYPRQREDDLLFKVLQAPYRTDYCRRYLPLCNRVITVSPGLANEYQRVFGVECELVRSVPVSHEGRVRECRENRIRLVHHGLANKNRQLDNMFDIFERLDSRFTFDLYLTGSPGIVNKLKKRIQDNPRIRILPPVPFKEIIPTLSQYDIGFYYLEPNGFNLLHSLPNKFFEFIQARLAVAIGPSPDMAALIYQHQCGFVAPEFSITSMASMLNSLSFEKINEAKHNSDLASHALCFEREKEKLSQILQDLANHAVKASTTNRQVSG